MPALGGIARRMITGGWSDGAFSWIMKHGYVIPSVVKRSRGICSKNTADSSTTPPAVGYARNDNSQVYGKTREFCNSKYLSINMSI